MGIVTSATILSTLVLYPVFSGIVESRGLIAGTTALAIVPIATAILCLFGIRETPESVGFGVLPVK